MVGFKRLFAACRAGFRRNRLLYALLSMLLLIGFMDEEKADHMMQGVQRIFSRGAFSADDVNILMGVARQADWAARHPRDAAQADP